MTTEPYDVTNDPDQWRAFWLDEVDRRMSEIFPAEADDFTPTVRQLMDVHDAVYEDDDWGDIA